MKKKPITRSPKPPSISNLCNGLSTWADLVNIRPILDYSDFLRERKPPLHLCGHSLIWRRLIWNETSCQELKKRKPFGVFCYASFADLVLCATVFVCIKIGPKTVPRIQIMLVKNIVLMFWYWAMHMGLIKYNNVSVERKESGVGSDENFKKTFQRYFYEGHENQCPVCHSNASFGSICLWPHIHLQLYVIKTIFSSFQTLPLHACLVVLKAEIETTKAGNQPPSSFHRIRLPFIFIQWCGLQGFV